MHHVKKIIKTIITSIPKNKHKIIFESHSDFTDSSRVLYDYLRKLYPGKYKYIWFVENKNKFSNTKDTKFIDIKKQYSIPYIYHVLTSKFIFFTHRSFRFINLNKQIVVNLTHGLPLKDSRGKLPTNETFNYLLSTNTNVNIENIKQFECDPNKIFISGLPRNDLLFSKNKEVTKLLKPYHSMIIWLPTFRKNKTSMEVMNDKVIPLFKIEELEELNNTLEKGNILLILKFHPAQDLSDFQNKEFSHLKFYSNKDLEAMNIHLYSLMAYASKLITDYSSVALDYVLLNRPIGYVVDDLNDFNNNRGFIFENYLDYCPGSQITNKKEFINFIIDKKDTYKKKREKVLNFYHQYQDNSGCKTIINKFHL